MFVWSWLHHTVMHAMHTVLKAPFNKVKATPNDLDRDKVMATTNTGRCTVSTSSHGSTQDIQSHFHVHSSAVTTVLLTPR
jgi:hypothetical protein